MGRRDELDRLRYSDNEPDETELSSDSHPHPAEPTVSIDRDHRLLSGMVLLLLMALLILLGREPRGLGQLLLPSLRSSDEPIITGNVDSTVPSVGEQMVAADGVDMLVTQSWNQEHMGIDLAQPVRDINGSVSYPEGAPLYAIGEAGADVEVYCWQEPLAGLTASTYSEGMDFAFDYAHLSQCITEPGERTTVRAGDQIAEVGNSGAATTGPHLHFQQRWKGTVDPITGEHIPGWKGYIELAITGKTLEPPLALPSNAQ